jgi:hypothetical protein
VTFFAILSSDLYNKNGINTKNVTKIGGEVLISLVHGIQWCFKISALRVDQWHFFLCKDRGSWNSLIPKQSIFKTVNKTDLSTSSKTTAATPMLKSQVKPFKKRQKSDALQSIILFTSRSKCYNTRFNELRMSSIVSLFCGCCSTIFSLQTVEWSRTHDTINDSSKILYTKT